MLRCDGGPSVKRRFSEDFAGTQRFEILRCLGAGGMGTVYEAFDRERKERVALKTLRAMNAESLLRFKHEFREFQDLSHPNLVSVGELFSDEGDWFFTMELLDGVDFLEYVRPGLARASNEDAADTIVTLPPVMEQGRRIMRVSSGTLLNEARLRTALRQLAFGLNALHEANKVHRDIKPSNILITERGRVVLLDFGLATELEGREHRSEVDIVGTVEYMAPEQAAARQVGPPADWYSIGVVLFEALTGQLPLVGPAIEVLMNKQRLDAPSPRALNPNAPEDLTQLCMDLMRFNPAQRPTGREVLDRLGAAAQSQSPSASLSSFSTSSSFVGRERELEQLRQRFERSRKMAQAVLVHGESGLGKSALVRRFVELVREREAGVVTLAGICYERESVPFKAVDGLIDALSQYMRRLPKAEAAALLPRRAGLLSQVFPVLQRVEAVAEAPRTAEEILDPQELRSRLFGALRELLSRLADRHALVLVIDDLQWADADSLALLGELVRPPEAPAMLLVATVRTDEHESAKTRRQSLAEHLRCEVAELALGRMSSDEARELAETLVRRAPGNARLNATTIANEAGGHPLFIDELIRHAVAVGTQSQGPLQLEDALWARICQLEPESRRVLELVTLASGRLLQATAANATGLSFADLAKRLALLRVAHLIRTTGTRSNDSVEPYHDRVRRAVLSHLQASSIRALHRRLAVALETSGQADPEALAVHWREAGEHDKTAHFARLAAKKAARMLAFDRAAHFYDLCLDAVPPTHPQRRELLVDLADALANGGRGAEAGRAFLSAAEGAAPAEALDLRRRAAEQLLRSGRIEEGVATLRTVLQGVGLKLSETPAQSLRSLLAGRMKLRLRGIGFREHDVTEVPIRDLTRIDTCWSAAAGLGNVDTIRGADFQTRCLLLALSSGEPYRIARALATEAAFASTGGQKSAARATRLLEAAETLAERLHNPHALGLHRLMSGLVAVQLGRWTLANERITEAERILREQCTGVAWELTTGHVFRTDALFYLGEVGELADVVPALTKEADTRGDYYGATTLRLSNMNFAWLVGDDVAAAREATEVAMGRWTGNGYLAQNYYDLLARTNLDLYAGNEEAGLQQVEQQWGALKSSLFLRVQVIRIEALHMRARALLAAAHGADAATRLRAVEQLARALQRESASWAQPMALLIRAGVQAHAGDNDAACASLEQAAALFDRHQMALYAASARRRLGALRGGADGERLVAEADAWMRERRIARPERVTAVLAPGFSR
jgi:eukaryotic-like serine/threonine-protein kinase